MKLIVGILINCSLLFAGNLTVKDSSVTISINGDKYILNEEDEKSFVDGSTICYEEGNGRIIIDNTIQLINKNNCIQTKIKDTSIFKKLVSNLENSLLVSFSNSKEKVLDGVSSKDINFDNKVETILLNSEQNYIVITSESSGPLPIILNIKDKEGKIIKSLTNETDTYTNFIVSAKDLEKTYNIEITNGFGIVIKTIKIN
ncbi:hypothetical protein [Aliarcobacter butzleri]|uniref:hypothetical protein n=1 Tax=Aliarcobacter butzleri TaxID=28197 RepID=UPI0012FCA1AF|nr:hypothetical protein [Aliarcobacter butzleri]MCT7586922.1 hypothetical protein [Aliarcobacter butzleri]